MDHLKHGTELQRVNTKVLFLTSCSVNFSLKDLHMTQKHICTVRGCIRCDHFTGREAIHQIWQVLPISNTSVVMSYHVIQLCLPVVYLDRASQACSVLSLLFGSVCRYMSGFLLDSIHITLLLQLRTSLIILTLGLMYVQKSR